MCVICYKTSKQKMPTKEKIEAMWRRNPDGAGIMWINPESHDVGFAKGFMSLKAFSEYIENNRDVFDTLEVAMHFRIGTHGGNTPGNTHPFRLIRNQDTGKMGQVHCPYPVMMHNGILPITPRRGDISDTAELALRAGAFDDPLKFMSAANEMFASNKIIVFDGKGAHFYGAEFKKGDDGLLYSNLNHEGTAGFFGRGWYGSGAYGATWNGSNWEDYWKGRVLESAANAGKAGTATSATASAAATKDCGAIAKSSESKDAKAEPADTKKDEDVGGKKPGIDPADVIGMSNLVIPASFRCIPNWLGAVTLHERREALNIIDDVLAYHEPELSKSIAVMSADEVRQECNRFKTEIVSMFDEYLKGSEEWNASCD